MKQQCFAVSGNEFTPIPNPYRNATVWKTRPYCAAGRLTTRQKRACAMCMHVGHSHCNAGGFKFYCHDAVCPYFPF